MSKKRIGILTSGGDCPGLNATIRGVARACYDEFGKDLQIIGIQKGTLEDRFGWVLFVDC